jgi:hypothetical protein
MKNMAWFSLLLVTCSLLIWIVPAMGFHQPRDPIIDTRTTSNLIKPAIISQGATQISKNAEQVNQVTPIKELVCNPVLDPKLAKFPNGAVGYCKGENFPLLERQATIARVDLVVGAARAPHWHDVWEVQTCLIGKVKTFLIDPKGHLYQGTLEPGMISFAPASWLHWLENAEDSPASVMFTWPGEVKTFALADGAGQVSPLVMKAIGFSDLKIKVNPAPVVRITPR